jgi:hypothetical protein
MAVNRGCIVRNCWFGRGLTPTFAMIFGRNLMVFFGALASRAGEYGSEKECLLLADRVLRARGAAWWMTII